MSRNGWKAGRKIRKREWHEMNSENLNKAVMKAIIYLWLDAFVLFVLLIQITEEGTIKDENLYLFVLGFMAIQLLVIIIQFVRAAKKDSG